MKRLNQSGAVSMITTVIFILVITIVATSYIRSILIQQKESINYDQTTRAFYAAEAGVQDAARVINTSIPLQTVGQDTCKTSAGYLGGSGTGKFASPATNLSYTCQIVDPTPDSLRGSLIPNQKTATMKLNAATNPKFLVIHWSKISDPALPSPLKVARSDASKLFPKSADWNTAGNQTHAAVRMSLINFPKTGSFTRSSIQQHVRYLNPANAFNYDHTPPTVSKGAGEPTEKVSNAQCYNNNSYVTNFSGYACEQIIELSGYNVANDNLYLHLGSIYSPTDFEVELQTSTSAPIPISSVQIAVDVTGKSGQTYRRVRETLPVAYTENNGPDAALVAGYGICKNFYVGTSDVSYDSTACQPTQ